MKKKTEANQILENVILVDWSYSFFISLLFFFVEDLRKLGNNSVKYRFETDPAFWWKRLLAKKRSEVAAAGA